MLGQILTSPDFIRVAIPCMQLIMIALTGVVVISAILALLDAANLINLKPEVAKMLRRFFFVTTLTVFAGGFLVQLTGANAEKIKNLDNELDQRESQLRSISEELSTLVTEKASHEPGMIPSIMEETSAFEESLASASTDEADQFLSIDGSPPIVFIQQREKTPSEKVRNILTSLESQGLVVPPVQTLKFGPSEAEVRYFIQGNEEIANDIADIANISNVVFVPGYGDKVPENQFEIWLSE